VGFMGQDGLQSGCCGARPSAGMLRLNWRSRRQVMGGEKKPERNRGGGE